MSYILTISQRHAYLALALVIVHIKSVLKVLRKLHFKICRNLISTVGRPNL